MLQRPRGTARIALKVAAIAVSLVAVGAAWRYAASAKPQGLPPAPEQVAVALSPFDGAGQALAEPLAPPPIPDPEPLPVVEPPTPTLLGDEPVGPGPTRRSSTQRPGEPAADSARETPVKKHARAERRGRSKRTPSATSTRDMDRAAANASVANDEPVSVPSTTVRVLRTTIE